MIRLVLGDLALNARVWLGALLVAAVTAVAGGVAASDIDTALAYGGNDGLALYGISGLVIALTLVTALIVVGSVANLTVTLQQRSYALWQLVGIGPGRVRAVVTVQLFLVALVGAVLGCLVAVPAVGPLFRYAFKSSDLAGLHPRFGAASAAVVVALVALIITLGGSRSAGRAARTPPIRSLRTPELPDRRMTAGRWIGGLVTLGITVAVLVSLPGTARDKLSVPLMLIGPLTAGVLAAFGPLFLARLLRGWTAAFPSYGAWYLARSNTAYNVSRSTATISPIMVAIALAGGLYAANGTVGGSLQAGEVVLLVGGPLLLSIVGAVATIFMSSRRREREFALIVAAGGTRGVVLFAAACEAIIYVGTALLLGAITLAVTGLAGGVRLKEFPSFGLGAAVSVAAVTLVLTLAATVPPTAVALRQEVPRTLAAE